MVHDSLYRRQYPASLPMALPASAKWRSSSREVSIPSDRVWQRTVMAGARLGPQTIGPRADWTDRAILIATPADAHRVIDSLEAGGAVCPGGASLQQNGTWMVPTLAGAHWSIGM